MLVKEGLERLLTVTAFIKFIFVVSSYMCSCNRYTGVVTGMAELDPIRWPGSKWRCLMVCICKNLVLLLPEVIFFCAFWTRTYMEMNIHPDSSSLP